VQLAYAIGVAEPVSVMVNTFGTGVIPEERFTELVRENFPLTPKGIIDHLKLRRPIYRKTAAFGHFGRTEDPSGKPPTSWCAITTSPSYAIKGEDNDLLLAHQCRARSSPQFTMDDGADLVTQLHTKRKDLLAST
jgi:hypothetical protein